MKNKKDCWHTYMVLCRDQTLYTGIAKDLEKRIEEHNGGRYGAKYTRTRRPVKLVYREKFSNRSEAAKREWQLKRMGRAAKLELMKKRD